MDFFDGGSVGLGMLLGFLGWFLVRHGLGGFFTVDQNQRAVKTVFGRAQRLTTTTLQNPIAEYLNESERERYRYPAVRVIPAGGPYFKWPWEKVHKASVATTTVNMAFDPEQPSANQNGTVLDAVTKDQLNVGLSGQVRFRISEANLYAFLFGVKNPLVHVMGYFISVLRERIANFEAPEHPAGKFLPAGGDHSAIPAGPSGLAQVAGVSINDLRKNLRDLNEHMEAECRSSAARYGIVLDASLITGIEPPHEVESALAAINTTHNQVASDISLAQASADQRIVQSKRAVEVEMLRAQAEVQPLSALAQQLKALKDNGGPGALRAYVRNVKLALFSKAQSVIAEAKK
ncbi:MAG TPA: SPFH domain-containing protein [Myxococcaceae bacterium]|jgi:regulator of protease activity HflC (stomatin/prohibitin superfamily)